MTVVSNFGNRTIRSFVRRSNQYINNTQQHPFASLSLPTIQRTSFSKYQRHTFYHQSTNRFSTAPADTDAETEHSVSDLLENVQSIEERQKCRSVVDSILLDPRTKMPFDEYMRLCELNQLNAEQAKKLSEALHTTGIIWHFNKYFEEQKPLIIKTNEVCKAFLRSMDLDGSIKSEFVKDKQEHLKRYVLEIKPLEEQHEEIELKARKYVRTCWRGFFVYVCGHCMVVPYLTFWKYSWDIMEPVTYMFNLWTLFMGTWFYMNSSSEFSNEGISGALLKMKKEKLYKKYNFDIQRYILLQEKIAEIEDDLFNPEWEMLKTVHPQIPDYIKHIHLTPAELIKTYEDEQKKELKL